MTEKHSPLLPCPFCGQPAVTHEWKDSGGKLHIECGNDDGCPVTVDIQAPPTAAVAAWNTRAAASAGPCPDWCPVAPASTVVYSNGGDGTFNEAEPDAEIVAALEPLAKAADNYADCDDKKYIDDDATVTVGNLRDARVALAKAKGGSRT